MEEVSIFVIYCYLDNFSINDLHVMASRQVSNIKKIQMYKRVLFF